MKPSSLPTLCLLLLASACGVEHIELRPRAGEPGAEAPSEPAPLPDDVEAPPPDDSVSAIDERPMFGDITNPDPPDTPALASGCSKLDLLFVLDNSFSMLDAQSKVAAAFPSLISALGQTAAGADLHVMVTDSDDSDGIGIPFLGGGECEDVLGAGKRTSSADTDCGLPESESFISSAQPELDAAFDCVADVGAFGDFGEQPMDALLGAISPGLNDPGGCNAGFLRRDAVLVTIVVTDEDDQLSSGDATVWHQALLDAKGGNEDGVVVLGLVGDNNVDGGLPGGPCSLIGADGTPELQRFVQLNRHHALASVCAADYSPFFEQSASIVDTACNAFVPP